MKIAEEIVYRRTKERDAVRLAAKYAKAKDYEQAASFYRAAAFHRALREHLQARKSRS